MLLDPVLPICTLDTAEDWLTVKVYTWASNSGAIKRFCAVFDEIEDTRRFLRTTSYGRKISDFESVLYGLPMPSPVSNMRADGTFEDDEVMMLTGREDSYADIGSACLVVKHRTGVFVLIVATAPTVREIDRIHNTKLFGFYDQWKQRHSS